MSGSVVEFQGQIASIMEVLANAAVAEICKVVDDGYAVVHLEISQSHKENEFLRRKMKLMELQIARFRAERTKSSEGSVHNRFHGIRLLNRHGNREKAMTGPTWQSRARLSNRSFGTSSIQRDRQPIDVDQEDVSPSKHMAATSDEQSGATEEGEPDLLIIKEEGEADDQDSRTSHPARTVEGSRELTTQPAAATTEDPAFQPRGNNYNYNNTAMEVSGSDAVLLQSETGNVNQGPQQHTGFEPRAEIQSLDTKCDMYGGLTLLKDSLNHVWREVVATDDGASAAHSKVMDLGSGPVGPETQTSSDVEMRSAGLENHRFSPKAFHSSSEHVIVIDSVSSGQEIDRDFEWGQVGTATTPQVNGTGNKQGMGLFNRNAPTICPVYSDSMRDNATQLVSPGFRPSGINTGMHLDTGKAGEANKASWCSLASLHKHSEIPGREAQQPAHTSLPDCHFRPSATTSSHSSNLATDVRPGTVERPYGCPSCYKKFVHESDLRRHTVVHTRKRGFACTLCEKSFVCASHLQMHQNVHTGEKPFSCAQCGRRFSHSSNLKRHQKLHHQSAKTEEGEPDLLIIKVEGEADDQDSRSSHPARTVEGSREPTTQTAAATNEDPAFQPCGPRGNNYINTAMEVSGSDAVLLQSETGNVNQGQQQHTGFEPRAERQSLDTKCDIYGGLTLLKDSLNQVWREVVATDDGASAAHSKVMDLGSGPVGPETQTSSDIEMRSAGLEKHRFSPKAFHSSSEHVIVIDSVSSGQQVDRDFEWGQVGTATTPQVNGTGNKQGVGVFEGNAPTIRHIHPDLMGDSTQLVSPSFRHTEKNTGTHLDTGSAGEANKFSWHSLASCHRHSEIPGRGTQQPAHSSLPFDDFRPSATTSSHLSILATDVRPGTVERPYGCPSCHKTFVHESDLRHHMVNHTRKRGYACTLCEKSFVSPSKLQVHQNVHTGEKPFSCTQCGRRFSHSGNLKRHQKIHH